MNRLLTLLLCLAVSLLSCQKKRRSERSQKSSTHSLVKLSLATKEGSGAPQDLQIILTRLKAFPSYKDPQITPTKEGALLTLSIPKETDKRFFLKTVSPLLKYRGEIRCKRVAPWPSSFFEDLKGTVHRVVLKGRPLLRSVKRVDLVKYLASKGAQFELQRFPKGTPDFPQNYWVAHKTGLSFPCTLSPERRLALPKKRLSPQKPVAVMLDSDILQLVDPESVKAPISDHAKRIKNTILAVILRHGTLQSAWRIKRIVAEQTL